jgi:hypothetical protein
MPEEAFALLRQWQPFFDEWWFERKLQNALKYAHNEEAEYDADDAMLSDLVEEGSMNDGKLGGR